LVKTRKVPKKIFGKKIDTADRKEMGVDSAGRGIIFLSESLTKIAVSEKNKMKLEVLSGRQSGSDGFGFSFPSFINFYNNNVNVITRQISPRGFVSPIADGALGYYRYKYQGSFWEDGKEVNQIKVIPRRKYEPLFSGTINITEGDWRIHSLDLMALRENQLELMDTLKIRQLQVPVAPGIWQTKDQSVYFTFNIMGFDAVGNFLNVYNKYELKPVYRKKYFNNELVKYNTAGNKKTTVYWDSIRPLPLELEEIKDYKAKDSAYQIFEDSMKSPAYRDSLRKKQGAINFRKIAMAGFIRNNFSLNHPASFSWQPLLPYLEYNTVEGLVTNVSFSVTRSDSSEKTKITLTPHFRYGFSNRHFNAWASLQIAKRNFKWAQNGGSSSRTSFTIDGGRRVSQFNAENQLSMLFSGFRVLLYKQNFVKIYENYFGALTVAKRFDSDLIVRARLLFEDRFQLENTTDFSIFKYKNRVFTPNYPVEKINSNFTRHQSLQLAVFLSYKPGQRFIEFPNSKVPIGSKYPQLNFEYHKGIEKLLSSDVDFDKWRFYATDEVNLKLRGLFKYHIGIGGFLNGKRLFIQDYQHFNGNQLFWASEYLNSFQLAPYYSNSTIESLYGIAHGEHHFNGLLTNKIPLFRKLKWNLVVGSNAFYVNRNNNYIEIFGGVENIFKVLRIDFVASYLDGSKGLTGVRFGLGGLLSRSINIR
jgi:hypothetical protein